MKKRELIIAIDFGTTYSGIAWSFGGDGINVIRSWPGTESTFDKVPSILWYSDTSFKIAGWGYQTAPDSTKVEWFKLHLAIQGQTPTKPLPFGLDAKTVITEYLRFLAKHCEQQITSGSGACLPRTLWDKLQGQIQYVLTVPASWNDQGRRTMAECFIAAGFVVADPAQLIILSEPEAAAEYYAVSKRGIFDWQENDNIMIIDAGGGTVDVVVYTVTSRDPFQVKESVKGDARFLGATFLDRNFAALIQIKLQYMPPVYQDRGYAKIVSDAAWEAWKSWKVDYSRGETQPLMLRVLPQDVCIEECSIENGILTLSSAELHPIFSTICQSIVKLLAEQLSTLQVQPGFSSSNKLFPILVGGFGRSRYLIETIRAALHPDFATNIGRFDDAWKAVVCGALVHGQNIAGGLQNTVQSTIARRHYLILCNEIFNPTSDAHSGLITIHEPRTGQVMVKTTHVYCEIGQQITVNQVFDQNFSRTITDTTERLFKTLLYESDCPGGPPRRLDHTCREICELQADLRSVSLTEFRKVHIPTGMFTKSKYYVISYTLRLLVGSGRLDLELWFKGVNLGRNSARIEFR